MSRKKLVIIDGNSLANRAFYAIQAKLTTKEGEPTNAVYGLSLIHISIASSVTTNVRIRNFALLVCIV